MDETIKVPWRRVEAFRLSRHHLTDRDSSTAAARIAGEMAGAQAQLLPAAQMSIWSRARVITIRDLDSAIWKDRTLVRAWCMRRTMFLLPSEESWIFVRGSSRRAAYHLRWAFSRVSSRQALDKLLNDLVRILDQPRTRKQVALELHSIGYALKSRAGGGWGDRRPVPWVKVSDASFPVGFLLHMIGARHAICCGPSVGNEATFIRTDAWLHNWKDLPIEQAEDELLLKYLKAFGPATVADFALWAGFYAKDAKEIWARAADKMVHVNIDGWNADVLEEDLSELRRAEVDGPPLVRLLPYFDSYLLGHKSHRNIVGDKDHRKVYRPQGWVAPILLVDGRARGVWSSTRDKHGLEIRVTGFSKLSRRVSSALKEEACDVGRFLGYRDVKTTVS